MMHNDMEQGPKPPSKPARIYKVPLVTPPATLHFSAQVQRNISKAKRLLRACRPDLAQQVSRQIALANITGRKAAALVALEHELSSHAMLLVKNESADSRNELPTAKKDLLERQAYVQFSASFMAAIEQTTPHNFIEVVGAIGSTVNNHPISFRNSPVATNPDAQGSRWVYPDARHVIPQLTQLWKYLSSSNDFDQIVRATVAHVMLASLHPFMDGNGRSARVVFNILVTHRLPVQVYLPYRQLFDTARQGYEIRMNKTRVMNDWTDIVTFFSNIIIANNSMQKKAIRQNV